MEDRHQTCNLKARTNVSAVEERNGSIVSAIQAADNAGWSDAHRRRKLGESMNGVAPAILIVDDELPIRRFLRATLTARDYRVVEAPNGKIALDLLAREPLDLIILDLGLPDIAGAEMVQRIRTTSRVPIVILSARSDEHSKVEALSSAPTITSPSLSESTNSLRARGPRCGMDFTRKAKTRSSKAATSKSISSDVTSGSTVAKWRCHRPNSHCFGCSSRMRGRFSRINICSARSGAVTRTCNIYASMCVSCARSSRPIRKCRSISSPNPASAIGCKSRAEQRSDNVSDRNALTLLAAARLKTLSSARQL